MEKKLINYNFCNVWNNIKIISIKNFLFNSKFLAKNFNCYFFYLLLSVAYDDVSANFDLFLHADYSFKA